MADPAESYEKMSDAERALFEREHFDVLPATDKFRIATFEFNSGQTVTGEKAVIIDHAYGNGDGVLNQEDLKIIAEKREDKAFNDALAEAGEAMFETAARATGLGAWAGAPAQSGFQLSSGGSLSQIFGESAANDDRFESFAHNMLEEILPHQIDTTPGALSHLFGDKASGKEVSEPSSIVNAPVNTIDNEEPLQQQSQLPSTPKAHGLG